MRYLSLFSSLFLLVSTSVVAAPPAAVEEIITAGDGWYPLMFKPQIEPGSIMDLSDTVEAPAGKHGRIIIDKDGHFATQDHGQRIRFYGNNLCFSANILPSAQCKSLARTFRQMGYNTVRFHHFDREITSHESGDSTKLDENMDRLDELFYEMKQQGLYVTVDLFVSRIFAANEIPGFEKIDPTSFKALMMVNDDAFANWAKYTSNLLNHVNPYTKLAWKDDPALFAICLTNENNITQAYRRSAKPVKEQVDAAFAKYLEKQVGYGASGDELKGWRTQFEAELQLATYLKCRKVVRDLGCKAYLTDANMQSQYHVTPARQAMDFVDSHAYWDHPQFVGRPWSLPERYRNTSTMSESVAVPRGIMGARQFGKPFMCTEFNFTFPNRYRAEAGPLMGAYAALQDWDGLYRFAYAHKQEVLPGEQPMYRFDTVKDPMTWLGERIAIDCFRRGGVLPATKRIAYAVTQIDLRNPQSGGWGPGQFANEFTKLGLAVQVGSYDARDAANKPVGVETIISTDGIVGLKYDKKLGELPEIVKSLGTGKADARKANFLSQTGEIALASREGELSVHTPRLSCFILKPQSRQSVGNITVENKDVLPVVVYIASADDQPLESSKRVLVMHLTDVQNSSMQFKTNKRQILTEIGSMPLLARDGQATLSWQSDHASELIAYAIDCSGKRLMPIKFNTDGSRIMLDLSVRQAGQTVLAYELVVP